MKKTIKILSVTFALIMMLSTFCVSAYYKIDGWEWLYINEDIKNDGTWFYELSENDKTAKICGYIGEDKDVIIPEIVEGEYTVTELILNTPNMDQKTFPVFGTQKNFETLTIPKTLKLISNYFSDEYYEYLDLSLTDTKKLRGRNEGELKYNGQVIMRGYFYSEPLHNLKAFIVDEENQYFSSKDGVLYNKDQSVLIQYPWGRSEKKFVIPNTVTQIMPYAICGYTDIEEIVITENVKILGDSCIGGISEYQELSEESSGRGSFLQLPVPSKRGYVTIKNNILDKEQLVHLFEYSHYYDEYKFKLTVYKDSPADKYFSVKREFSITEIIKRLDNPYAKKEEPKGEEKKDDKLSPQTGDNITIIVALLFVTSLAVVILGISKKRINAR